MACAAHATSSAEADPIPPILREAISRREFLQHGIVEAATFNTANSTRGPQVRIVIIGAGLAGLTCAYRLKQAGQIARIFEASDHIGGRCHTGRGQFSERQMYEHGGEFIDTGHTQIRKLAAELGLTLEDLARAERKGTQPLYYFDGGPYSSAEAIEDLKPVWRRLHADRGAAGSPTLYNKSTPRGRELDHMSITEWIDDAVPGGMGSRLGRLLDITYNTEYGAECSEQSALNLIYLLGYSGTDQPGLLGASDERYHVRGGNGRIAARLAKRLSTQIEHGTALIAIRQLPNGAYQLQLRRGAQTRTVTAGKVVLALPFSILRSHVDYSHAGFNAVKCRAIAELGMGTNSKLHIQTTTRHWEALGCNGSTTSETGYQTTWESTRGQSGSGGILANYTGGKVGASFGKENSGELAKRFLTQLEPVMPGITNHWNGRATIDSWPDYRWTKGSFSYWKVGQYTRFAGAEREQSGNCHFAGEHTSVEFQGYMNGAVESGERAAAEILSDLRRLS